MKINDIDVTALAKLCRQYGIKKFEMPGITMDFGAESQNKVNKIKDNPKKRMEEETQALQSQEQTVREDQMDLMLLEDPLEYERLEAQGELDGKIND